ncbi:YbjN domain-containing protein [Micromonospora harpali]|uniref:YbjN domain-containing protein n=1 Tax=Micromonospora harpali TaxID=1490225 RepID=UPI00338F74A5
MKLFEELKRLHRTAGEPTMRQIAKNLPCTYATVHSAMRGPRVPKWPLLELIVEKLGGNTDHFKQLWIAALDSQELHRTTSSAPPASSTNLEVSKARHPELPSSTKLPELTIDRLQTTLDYLEIAYSEEGERFILARWSRHTMLFATEGPAEDILVMRVHPDATLPLIESERVRFVLNEWNHTRRFMKAYMGDPTEANRIPIYGEVQISLSAGATDNQLVEFVDCGAAVGTSLVDWLHNEVKILGDS